MISMDPEREKGGLNKYMDLLFDMEKILAGEGYDHLLD